MMKLKAQSRKRENIINDLRGNALCAMMMSVKSVRAWLEINKSETIKNLAIKINAYIKIQTDIKMYSYISFHYNYSHYKYF